MEQIQELIDQLIAEHKEYLSILKDMEKDLSQENIQKLIILVENQIENHAQVEENKLRELAEDKFDFEAFVFGHQQIRMVCEELKDHPSAERALRLIDLLKVHFSEEETLYFPTILGYEPEIGEL
jgi:hemerythrin